jgi:hypothetical protein
MMKSINYNTFHFALRDALRYELHRALHDELYHALRYALHDAVNDAVNEYYIQNERRNKMTKISEVTEEQKEIAKKIVKDIIAMQTLPADEEIGRIVLDRILKLQENKTASNDNWNIQQAVDKYGLAPYEAMMKAIEDTLCEITKKKIKL